MIIIETPMKLLGKPLVVCFLTTTMLLVGSACTGHSSSSSTGVGSPAGTPEDGNASIRGVSQDAKSLVARTYREAPALELKDIAGKVHRLEEFRGQPVILHFWASWCPPCIEELPQFMEMVKSLRGKPIHFLIVSLDKTWMEAERIAPQKELPSDVVSVIDPDGTVPEKFGSFQFPETYLLNSRLQILEKWVGAQDWNGGKTRTAIDQILGGK